jgi:uncharacterized damage-inducible protein DinB
MPADLLQTFRAFAYNNAWANHRLLKSCARLDQAAFEAGRTGFFPSLQATLNHIHVIDLFYVDALEGGWLGPRAWVDPVPYKEIATLQPAQAAIDARLIAHCEALASNDLDSIVRINRDTRVQTERRDRLLMHLFQHQIHHRGQAHGMLSATSVAPPQLDEFFAEGEAPLRADDFGELGWTEATIWNDRPSVDATGTP